MDAAKRYPLSRALLLILVWTVAISGSATAAFVYRQQLLQKRLRDSVYLLSKVKQVGSDRGRLPDEYYAALLGLNTPTNAYAFDSSEAAARIRTSPWLESAKISVQLPNKIRIRPEVREPIARIHDVEGTLMDRSGSLFPELPTENYSYLPSLYLGKVPDGVWGQHASPEVVALAREVFEAMRHDDLQQLDLANAFAPSLGRREIVVKLDGCYLRLSPRNWRQQVHNYHRLRDRMSEALNGQLIDLRIDQLAFLTATGQERKRASDSVD